MKDHQTTSSLHFILINYEKQWFDFLKHFVVVSTPQQHPHEAFVRGEDQFAVHMLTRCFYTPLLPNLHADCLKSVRFCIRLEYTC